MADKSKENFKDLSPEAQEAVTPRGTYFRPEALDQGTGYPGAPKGGDTPNPVEVDNPDLAPSGREEMRSQRNEPGTANVNASGDATEPLKTTRKRTA